VAKHNRQIHEDQKQMAQMTQSFQQHMQWSQAQNASFSKERDSLLRRLRRHHQRSKSTNLYDSSEASGDLGGSFLAGGLGLQEAPPEEWRRELAELRSLVQDTRNNDMKKDSAHCQLSEYVQKVSSRISSHEDEVEGVTQAVLQMEDVVRERARDLQQLVDAFGNYIHSELTKPSDSKCVMNGADVCGRNMLGRPNFLRPSSLLSSSALAFGPHVSDYCELRTNAPDASIINRSVGLARFDSTLNALRNKLEHAQQTRVLGDLRKSNSRNYHCDGNRLRSRSKSPSHSCRCTTP